MNLLAPDLLTEVYVMIRRDGTMDVFQDKITLTPEIVATLCRAFLNMAVLLAEQHGVNLEARIKVGPRVKES